MIKDYENRKKEKFFNIMQEHIIAIIITFVVIIGIISTIYIVKTSEEKSKLDNLDGNVSYRDSDTIYLAMEKADTLNPYYSISKDVYNISDIVYDSLFDLGDDLSLIPELVNTYETNKEQGTVTITLKDNVKFSDGTPLKSSDVRSSVFFIQDIGERSPYFSYAFKIRNVVIDSDKKFTIYFKDKFDAALDNLTFPIVSASSYIKGDKMIKGTGRYSYKEYDEKKSLLLEPNEFYYGEPVKNKVEIAVLPDITKVPILMSVDRVTGYVDENQDADMIALDLNLKKTPIVSGECEYLGFNFKSKTVKDEKLRKAIAYAIDTSSLIKDNYGGSAVLSDSVYFPGFLGVGKKEDAYPLNREKATKLLSEIGYTDKNKDRIVENKKGEDLCLNIVLNNSNQSRMESAEMIKKDLKKIGIKVNIKILEKNKLEETLKNGDFDIYMGGISFDKRYNFKKMFAKGNLLSYTNEVAVREAQNMELALTAEEEKEAFEELHSTLLEDLPFYCLCYKTYTFVTTEHFEGDVLPTFFSRYRGCDSWKWQVAILEQESEEKK